MATALLTDENDSQWLLLSRILDLEVFIALARDLLPVDVNRPPQTISRHTDHAIACINSVMRDLLCEVSRLSPNTELLLVLDEVSRELLLESTEFLLTNANKQRHCPIEAITVVFDVHYLEWCTVDLHDLVLELSPVADALRWVLLALLWLACGILMLTRLSRWVALACRFHLRLAFQLLGVVA